MKKILITGANGFVGSWLRNLFVQNGHDIVSATRADVGSIDGTTDWSKVLKDVDQVIHLAARAHVKHHPAGERLDWYREVNAHATLNLGEQALTAGVRKFVFLSTIGVLGDGSRRNGNEVLDETSTVDPTNDYAVSKYEAECALNTLFENADAELFIIRPPLIYGANAPGNFRKLLKLADSSLPVPFAKIDNSRSMLSIVNLCDFLLRVSQATGEHSGTYVLADNECVSTQQIVDTLRQGMGRPRHAFAVAPALMKAGANLLGKLSMYQQLCENLEISNEKAKATFDWEPPLSASDALYQAAQSYSRKVSK